ncbi:MAG: hypothetical protein GY915_03860 [bacterium]|nr:hypothetical protein [bacterium]
MKKTLFIISLLLFPFSSYGILFKTDVRYEDNSIAEDARVTFEIFRNNERLYLVEDLGSQETHNVDIQAILEELEDEDPTLSIAAAIGLPAEDGGSISMDRAEELTMEFKNGHIVVLTSRIALHNFFTSESPVLTLSEERH